MELANCIHLLSILALAPDEDRMAAAAAVRELDQERWESLVAVASAHHVVVRALGGSEDCRPGGRGEELVAAELDRSKHALSRLAEACSVLSQEGFSCVVIRSLDHWPDLGTDLDLLTCSPEAEITKVLSQRLGASIESATWSDRVAHKVNYRLPDLQELIEVHFGRLGQAGEHVGLAGGILNRCVLKEVGGEHFCVPSDEDRILLAVLQRLYRHFYLRVCDITDTASLIDSAGLDLEQLRSRGEAIGVWRGTATFLRLVSDYAEHYRGEPLLEPDRLLSASRFGLEKVFAAAGFLRLPMFPQAADLYLRQVASALNRRDSTAGARLGLIPPLALAAALHHRLTGNVHGIW